MKHAESTVNDMEDGADSSVSETNPSEETKGKPTTHVDKNVTRSKKAAFFVLGLAAVGLGFMTFFLMRKVEVTNFEDQVSSLSDPLAAIFLRISDLVNPFHFLDSSMTLPTN